MKNLVMFFSLLAFFSCSKLLNEPKNLVPKEIMAKALADLAVSDQLGYLGQPGNMEIQTKYILKKYGITGKSFTDSYKYYLSTKDLPGIYNDAQDFVKDKDPDAAAYIKKRLDEEKRNTLQQAH